MRMGGKASDLRPAAIAGVAASVGESSLSPLFVLFLLQVRLRNPHVCCWLRTAPRGAVERLACESSFVASKDSDELLLNSSLNLSSNLPVDLDVVDLQLYPIPDRARTSYR